MHGVFKIFRVFKKIWGIGNKYIRIFKCEGGFQHFGAPTQPDSPNGCVAIMQESFTCINKCNTTPNSSIESFLLKFFNFQFSFFNGFPDVVSFPYAIESRENNFRCLPFSHVNLNGASGSPFESIHDI